MEFLLVILIVVVAVMLLSRGPRVFRRRGPSTVVRPELRRRVADEAAWRDDVVADDPLVEDDTVVRRRTVIDEY